MGIPNYQYEPLTPPSSWNADEKRLLQRITDIFDDIYMKWGRLDSNHIAASGVKEKNIAPNAITDSKILSVDAAKVNRLDAVSFEAVTARIQDLAADLITTNGFTAKWAEIASAAISHLRVKYSDTEEAIIRDGIGGEIYIDRLTATSATFISATMGELVVKGDDGKYYEITVRSDGTINTDEVTVSGGEIAAGQTSEGKKIVETEIDVVALNAQNIKVTSAIIGSIFTTALTAGKITAGEALIASATIPTLYTTSIEAIGNSLTFSANGTISALAEQIDLRVSEGDLATYLRLDRDTRAVEIGDTSSDYRVRVMTDRLNITEKDGPPVAYFAYNKMFVSDAEVSNTLRFGNYYVMPASDGGVKFVRV